MLVAITWLTAMSRRAQLGKLLLNDTAFSALQFINALLKCAYLQCMGVDQSYLRATGIQLLDTRVFSLHDEAVGCLIDILPHERLTEKKRPPKKQGSF